MRTREALGEWDPAGDEGVAEVARRLRTAVNRLHRRFRQESLDELSPAQASALATVSRRGDPTLGELAALEQVRPPTISRIVGGLADAGLIERVVDPLDRRCARVRITATGARTLEQIRVRRDEFLLRGLAALDPAERGRAAELVALLEHLLGER